MDIEIKKLTPNLIEDYLHFFETDAHSDNPNEDRCYCVCWCSADHRIETDFSSPEKRRELAVKYINGGIIQGYLAYAGDKVVGWCNANTKSNCLNCTSWLRFKTAVNTTEPSTNIKIKSIYCFAISPNMRRRGISALLLDRICDDAINEGFDLVEAYPEQYFTNVFSAMSGHMELYKKKGFTIYQEINDKYKGKYDLNYYVVRKSLK